MNAVMIIPDCPGKVMFVTNVPRIMVLLFAATSPLPQIQQQATTGWKVRDPYKRIQCGCVHKYYTLQFKLVSTLALMIWTLHRFVEVLQNHWMVHSSKGECCHVSFGVSRSGLYRTGALFAALHGLPVHAERAAGQVAEPS